MRFDFTADRLPDGTPNPVWGSHLRAEKLSRFPGKDMWPLIPVILGAIMGLWLSFDRIIGKPESPQESALVQPN